MLSIHIPWSQLISNRIIDGSGREMWGADACGEIIIKSPSIMSSYLKNKEATEATVRSEWLHTGDIGYQKDGKWYIIDRAKVRSAPGAANFS